MERRGQAVLASDAAGPLPDIRWRHCGRPDAAWTGHQAGSVRCLQVADGVEGLVHLRELTWSPVDVPEDVVEVTVVVTEIDRERRRLALSRRRISRDPQ
ncbi:S1 RNA-binding domain-containing protein [Streptomyces mirabilis]|uniref:S1 RNA-binding domain-containing protein n=1 Tax=Streptomyces mirabilis TaxID=68239 RepID=UPI0036386A11